MTLTMLVSVLQNFVNFDLCADCYAAAGGRVSESYGGAPASAAGAGGAAGFGGPGVGLPGTTVGGMKLLGSHEHGVENFVPIGVEVSCIDLSCELVNALYPCSWRPASKSRTAQPTPTATQAASGGRFRALAQPRQPLLLLPLTRPQQLARGRAPLLAVWLPLLLQQHRQAQLQHLQQLRHLAARLSPRRAAPQHFPVQRTTALAGELAVSSASDSLSAASPSLKYWACLFLQATPVQWPPQAGVPPPLACPKACKPWTWMALPPLLVRGVRRLADWISISCALFAASATAASAAAVPASSPTAVSSSNATADGSAAAPANAAPGYNPGFDMSDVPAAAPVEPQSIPPEGAISRCCSVRCYRIERHIDSVRRLNDRPGPGGGEPVLQHAPAVPQPVPG